MAANPTPPACHAAAFAARPRSPDLGFVVIDEADERIHLPMQVKMPLGITFRLAAAMPPDMLRMHASRDLACQLTRALAALQRLD
jgi:hypothetical protein